MSIVHGAARPSTKPRRAFLGDTDNELPWTERILLSQQEKKSVVISPAEKIPFAAAALHGEGWPHAWEWTEGTLPGSAGCAPSMTAACLPWDILGVMSQTAALAKRTVLLDKGRYKTYNTRVRSILKSLAAGCVGCLGSYAGFFLVCSVRCRHLNSCWKGTGVFKASCDFAICWFICLPICGTYRYIWINVYVYLYTSEVLELNVFCFDYPSHPSVVSSCKKILLKLFLPQWASSTEECISFQKVRRVEDSLQRNQAKD